MLSEQPVRISRDWNAAVVAYCDFCSHTSMTVPHADGGRICASCCDSELLSNWQNYARSLATELLSLREQLAEIEALPPIAWNVGNQHGEIVGLFDTENAAKLMASNWMYGKVIPLIAKPAEDKCS